MKVSEALPDLVIISEVRPEHSHHKRMVTEIQLDWPAIDNNLAGVLVSGVAIVDVDVVEARASKSRRLMDERGEVARSLEAELGFF